MGGSDTRGSRIADRGSQIVLRSTVYYPLSAIRYLRFMCILFVLFFPMLCVAATETLSGLNTEQFEQKTDDSLVWRNNPFVQPTVDVAISDLKLTGVVFREDDAAAIINDKIVKKGDWVGSNEVLSIEKTRVIIRNEGGLFSLYLEGGN